MFPRGYWTGGLGGYNTEVLSSGLIEDIILSKCRGQTDKKVATETVEERMMIRHDKGTQCDLGYEEELWYWLVRVIFKVF